MKQDKLENFIQQHRDDFDQEEPPFGLFDQIERDLDAKEEVKTKRIPLHQRQWVGIAAGIILPIIVLSVVLLFVKTGGPSGHTKPGSKWEVAEYSPELIEMAETEAYYKREIEQKEDKLKSLLAYNPELSEEVSETLNDMNQSYAMLNSDLQMNVNNQDIMDAIVNHQRMTLQTIEDLIHQIEASKMH